MFVLRFLLEQYVDERSIVDIIISYLGNECQKCYQIQNEPLTCVLKWNIGTYFLDDIPNNDYHLRKVCQDCTYRRCSSMQVYIEIPNERLMFPLNFHL